MIVWFNQQPTSMDDLRGKAGVGGYTTSTGGHSSPVVTGERGQRVNHSLLDSDQAC